MRKRLAILAVLWASAAMAAVINSQGTAGAPVSVSTVTKVLKGQPNRTAWCIESESVSVRCNVGTVSDTAASPAPTSTVGWLVASGTVFCSNSGFNSNIQAPIDPKQRLDCTSTGGATSLDTWETY